MTKCKECKTELVKADIGMKCPNWFNCGKYDIETDESIITQLQTALKVKELEANELMDRIKELEGVG